MKYMDKRLIGDDREKEWIVSLINGDVETHYVQPNIGQATFDTKHEAMQEIRRIMGILWREHPEYYITDRFDYEDFVKIKMEGWRKFWLTARCVVKNGHINLL